MKYFQHDILKLQWFHNSIVQTSLTFLGTREDYVQLTRWWFGPSVTSE